MTILEMIEKWEASDTGLFRVTSEDLLSYIWNQVEEMKLYAGDQDWLNFTCREFFLTEVDTD